MSCGTSPPHNIGDEDPTRSLQAGIAETYLQIGPYTLVRKLGEGGMGVVYHAQQIQPIRRQVALKIIKPGMDSRQVIARFESERQALALMDHPNIARVYDAGTTEKGLPFFVMELVDGVPITSYCDSKMLGTQQRIHLFLPVCQAIQHAHQKGIIHRDIKPSNVLVKQQEGSAVPKVIDFGLAKALADPLSDNGEHTQFGSILGSLDYMSPEQADLGRQDIDTRSDVYSLGVLLYELLTGTTPLEYDRSSSTSYIEILRLIREKPLASPSSRLSTPERKSKSLDRELDWIAMKALDKDRARRYETANGLLRDLQRYLAGEPVEAGPPSGTYRLGKFARKYRSWFAIGAAFVFMLAIAVGVSTWMALQKSIANQEARAVLDFLEHDVLAQASAYNQALPNHKPDPDIKVRTALDRAAASIGGKFQNQPVVEASIRETIGRTYSDLSLYPQAETQIRRALELRRRALGENHPGTIASMADVAMVLERQGKSSESEPLYASVLELRTKKLGPDHPDTLVAMNGLAAVYYQEHKLSQAEVLFAQLLDRARHVLGEDDPLTLRAMQNLAAVYHVQSKYSQAEPLYERCLEIRRRVSGSEHPETLKVLVNLAELYGDEGKYTDSERLYNEGLETERRVLGESDRNTIYTMWSLANLYRREGKYDDAETLFLRAQDSTRHGLGEKHPLTLDVLSGLADTYLGEGKFDKAEELYAKTLSLRQETQGPEHFRTISTMASLGLARLRQHKYLEAASALQTALDLFKKNAPDDWRRYDCEALLGASLAGQQKYAEAEPLLIGGYEGMIQRQATIAAGDQGKIRDDGEELVELYRVWHKPDKAAEWQSKLKPAA